MKTQKYDQIRPDQTGNIYDIGFMIADSHFSHGGRRGHGGFKHDDFGLQAGFVDCLEDLVAGESGVALRFPPQSKTLQEDWKRWRVCGRRAGDERHDHESPVISHDFPTKNFGGAYLRAAVCWRTSAEGLRALVAGESGVKAHALQTLREWRERLPSNDTILNFKKGQ